MEKFLYRDIIKSADGKGHEVNTMVPCIAVSFNNSTDGK